MAITRLGLGGPSAAYGGGSVPSSMVPTLAARYEPTTVTLPARV